MKKIYPIVLFYSILPSFLCAVAPKLTDDKEQNTAISEVMQHSPSPLLLQPYGMPASILPASPQVLWPQPYPFVDFTQIFSPLGSPLLPSFDYPYAPPSPFALPVMPSPTLQATQVINEEMIKTEERLYAILQRDITACINLEKLMIAERRCDKTLLALICSRIDQFATDTKLSYLAQTAYILATKEEKAWMTNALTSLPVSFFLTTCESSKFVQFILFNLNGLTHKDYQSYHMKEFAYKKYISFDYIGQKDSEQFRQVVRWLEPCLAELVEHKLGYYIAKVLLCCCQPEQIPFLYHWIDHTLDQISNVFEEEGDLPKEKLQNFHRLQRLIKSAFCCDKPSGHLISAVLKKKALFFSEIAKDNGTFVFLRALERIDNPACVDQIAIFFYTLSPETFFKNAKHQKGRSILLEKCFEKCSIQMFHRLVKKWLEADPDGRLIIDSVANFALQRISLTIGKMLKYQTLFTPEEVKEFKDLSKKIIERYRPNIDEIESIFAKRKWHNIFFNLKHGFRQFPLRVITQKACK